MGQLPYKFTTATWHSPDPGNNGTIDHTAGRLAIPMVIGSSGAEASTLPRPTKPYQERLLYVRSCGSGTRVVTVTGGYDLSGSTTLTFSAARQYVKLVSVESAAGTYCWEVGEYDGVVGPTVALGSITTADIKGNDSSLGITGQAAAAGGAVAIAGGASSGSNAGGAVTLTGGAGGASQTGGAVTVAGGVPASGNAAGGAVSYSGGAGSGTGAGGAASLVGGASGGGATGNGGAVAVTAGAAVSSAGNGGAVTVTAGVATSTGTGGSITITAGASAGGSGTAGSVNIASGAPAGGTVGAVNVQTVAAGKLGFFGATAVVKQATLTQTYSTADATLANDTASDMVTTASTQTTPWGFASQAQADAIATKFNLLRADVDDVKQFVNSLVDGLQAYGLFG